MDARVFLKRPFVKSWKAQPATQLGMGYQGNINRISTWSDCTGTGEVREQTRCPKQWIKTYPNSQMMKRCLNQLRFEIMKKIHTKFSDNENMFKSIKIWNHGKRRVTIEGSGFAGILPGGDFCEENWNSPGVEQGSRHPLFQVLLHPGSAPTH